ncbi:hypothetical protein BLOT_008160 [Blomia tropicalis]|nr:hypothetical protein BLOT_008160 [Blomia tropicalis]
MANFGTISILAMGIKLNQICKLLFPKRLKRPSRSAYRSFLKHMNETMYLFSVANLSLGKALFAYIIVNCPINCVIVVAILNGSINSIISLFITSIYALHQFICIFIIHIFIVNLNSKLYKPVKRVIHLSLYDRKLTKFSRIKMKIHNYIITFHTKKKYGITYASFGLITMPSFFKFIFLYIEECIQSILSANQCAGTIMQDYSLGDENHKLLDRKAYSILLQCLNDQDILLIMGSSSISGARVQSKFKELMNLKIEFGHLKGGVMKFSLLINEIEKMIGCKMNEAVKCHHLIAVLPDGLESVVNSFIVMKMTDLKFNDLKVGWPFLQDFLETTGFFTEILTTPVLVNDKSNVFLTNEDNCVMLTHKKFFGKARKVFHRNQPNQSFRGKVSRKCFSCGSDKHLIRDCKSNHVMIAETDLSIGEVMLSCKVDDVSLDVHLTNARFAPCLSCNLVSVRKLVEKGAKIIFENDIAHVSFDNRKCMVAKFGIYSKIFPQLSSHRNGKLENVLSIKTNKIVLLLNQIRNLLYPKRLKRPSRSAYRSFLKHMNETMYLFSVANSSFGKAMFAYMIVNCPINCVIVVAILNGVPNSFISLFINSIYALHQFLCIFIIHIFIVNVNGKIHRPVKRITHLSVCDQKLTKFSRIKMKIHNYIMAFHTKKKYGITYASFGLISMSSFVKPKKITIIPCDDLFDFDVSWISDPTQWPGAHQTSAKKKIARWFQDDEIILGMIVDIGSHESVSKKLKSLVDLDLIKTKLSQLINKNNSLKQIHNETNQRFKYVGPSKTLIMYLDLMVALNHSMWRGSNTFYDVYLGSHSRPRKNLQKIMDILMNEIVPIKGIKYVEKYFRNYYPTEMENWEIFTKNNSFDLRNQLQTQLPTDIAADVY